MIIKQISFYALFGDAGNLKWLKEGTEVEAAMIGETVMMYADLEDVEDGKNFTVKVYEKDYTTENDLLDTFTGESRDGKLELSWTVRYVEDTDDENSEEEQAEKGYTKPEYIFVLESKELEIKEESPVLEFQDWIEVVLKNEKTGEIYANTDYTLKMPDGEEREGKTDERGFLREEDVPPGMHEILIDAGPGVKKMKWEKDGEEVTKAKLDDEVKMIIEFNEIEDGEKVKVTLYEKDYDGSDDEIEGGRFGELEIKDGKIEIDWKVIYVSDDDDINSDDEMKKLGYTMPEYIFVAESQKYGFVVESPVLEFSGWIKQKLINEFTDEPMKNVKYTIHFPDGSTKEGETDGDGYINEEDIAMSNCYITIEEI